jgi:hypothetical protein
MVQVVYTALAPAPASLPTRTTPQQTKTKNQGPSVKIKLLTNKNPKRSGSKSHARFQAMMDFLKSNPDSTLSAVLAQTSYTMADLKNDVRHRFLRLRK